MANEDIWLMIVETDLVARHPLAEYLRQCGYKVLEASNSDEAMTLLTRAKVAISIVLCDVRSPGKVDGFGLARWLRENQPQIQVILAGSMARAAEKAGDLCEDGPLLAKPYDHALLLDRIKRLLAARDRNRS